MIIENSFELPMSPGEAWPLLTDVARVAPCMPGAKLTEAVDADTWSGELTVKLGPVGMRFVGEVRFVARNPDAGLARAEASARETRNTSIVREALAPDAPRAHADAEDNLAGTPCLEYGDVDAALAGAAHVVRRALFQHRGGGHAIECRTLLAQYDPMGESVTIWAGTQSPYKYRDAYADVMGMEQHRVRVIAPDVGGGLGPFEGVSVKVQRDGRVLLATGAAAQGQGHRTMRAQVCADALGVDVNDVVVTAADTAASTARRGGVRCR